MIDSKSIRWVYQEKKISVKVKDVGNYKIHVKETFCANMPVMAIWVIMIVIGAILECSFFFNDRINPLIPLGGAAIALIFLLSVGVTYSTPAYYVDTTMYGVGGKTIRKITPAQDHIAICQAAQEFEKEILERINKEKELEEIVGTCK